MDNNVRIFVCLAICFIFCFLTIIPNVRAFTIHRTGLGTGSIGRPLTNASNLTSGLIGWWTMDGKNLINNVKDSSGQGNNGVLFGYAATSSAVSMGRLGQALQFGSGKSVTLSLPNMAGDYTLSAWIKSSDPTSPNCILQGAGVPLFCVFVDKIDFYFSGNHYSNTPVATSTWVHVAFVNSGGSGTFYLNGVADGTTGSGVPAMQITILGNDDVDEYVRGSLDDVRVYNRALSVQDMVELYKTGQTVVNKSPVNYLTNGLLGYWTFDGADVTTKVFDRSGQSNNGYFIDLNNPGGNSTSSAKTVGKLGQAFSFNGTSTYVDIANSGAVADNLQNMTVSAWFKTSTSSASFMAPIVSKYATGFAASAGWIFGIVGTGVPGVGSLAPPVGSVYGFIQENGGSNWRGQYHSAANDGKWHNFTMVVTTGNTVKGYFDGSTAGMTDSNGGSTPASYTNTSNIRVSTDYNSDFLTGAVDEVRVYNRAFTDTEILEMYNLAR
jgi:hypothetical protein